MNEREVDNSGCYKESPWVCWSAVVFALLATAGWFLLLLQPDKTFTLVVALGFSFLIVGMLGMGATCIVLYLSERKYIKGRRIAAFEEAGITDQRYEPTEIPKNVTGLSFDQCKKLAEQRKMHVLRRQRVLRTIWVPFGIEVDFVYISSPNEDGAVKCVIREKGKVIDYRTVQSALEYWNFMLFNDFRPLP